MKVLFQAPLMSPTWKGFVSNNILNEVKDLITSSINISDGYELLHDLGEEFEKNLEVTVLSINSSTHTIAQTYDIQIIVSDWKDAWNLVLPNAINIVIGLDEDYHAMNMLANCYKKVHYTELGLEHKYSKEEYENSNSQFKELPIDKQNFIFVYPDKFHEVNKDIIESWIVDVENLKEKRIIVYYPELYSDPQMLAQAFGSTQLLDIDIDIIASPETINSLNYLINHKNCEKDVCGKEPKDWQYTPSSDFDLARIITELKLCRFK